MAIIVLFIYTVITLTSVTLKLILFELILLLLLGILLFILFFDLLFKHFILTANFTHQLPLLIGCSSISKDLWLFGWDVHFELFFIASEGKVIHFYLLLHLLYLLCFAQMFNKKLLILAGQLLIKIFIIRHLSQFVSNILSEEFTLMDKILFEEQFSFFMDVLSHRLLSNPYIFLNQFNLFGQYFNIDFIVHYLPTFVSYLLQHSPQQFYVVSYLIAEFVGEIIAFKFG